MVKKFCLVLFSCFLFVFGLIGCDTEKDPIKTDEITISVEGGSGSGKYEKDENVTIVATVPEGKIFSKWVAGTSVLSTDETYTFPASVDLEISAVYTLIEYTATFKTPVMGYQGNSLEFKQTAVNNNPADLDFIFKNDSTALINWTGAEELWVYVNASEFKAKTPELRIAFETTDVNGSRIANRLREDANCYIIGNNSAERTALQANIDGFIRLPEHFVGWLCIPLNYETLVKYWTSGPSTENIVLSDVHQFMIAVKGDENSIGSSFYLDAFGFVGVDVKGKDLPVSVSELAGYEYVQAWNLENLSAENSLEGILIDWQGVRNYYDVNIFVPENEVVSIVKFTVDTEELDEPEIPEKPGFVGTWESYTIAANDLVIYAVYTPIQYKVTFKIDGEVVAEIPFDTGDGSIDEPALPERVGYNAAWESYTLEASDLVVNAVYMPIEYTATFVSEGYKGISYGYQGNALEYYHYAINPPLGDLDFIFKNDQTAITDWTGAKELWVYVNASKFNDSTPELRINYQSTDSNGVLTANRIKFGATYYLVRKNGTSRTSHTALADGFVSLPNKFEGWLCIPLDKDTLECYWSSGERTGEVVLNDVHQFMITVNGESSSVGSYLYLDAFGFIGTDVDGDALPVNVAELSGYQFVQAWDFENLGFENSLTGITNDFFGTLNYYRVKVVGLEGNVVKRVKFTVETTELDVPNVPYKEGFIGVWENYSLDTTDLTINALYTPDENYKPEFTATFLADGEVVEIVMFNRDTTELNEPDVPEKVGYTGVWETYTLDKNDLEINAIYTPIEFNAVFKTPGNGYSGNALEFYRYNTHEGGFGDIDFAFRNDPTAITNWTGAEELWVYVNASKFSDSTPKLRVNFQFTDSNGVAVATRIKVGASYYLIEKNGTTRSTHAALDEGYVALPNQFEGWLCIPLEKESLEFYWSSGERTGEVVLNDVNQFMITVNGDNSSVGSYFYLDAFGFIGSTVLGTALPVNVDELSGYQFVEAWDLEHLGFENSLNGIMNDFFNNFAFYQVNVQVPDEVVETVKFTVEDTELVEPVVPERPGYTGVWETYSIAANNLVIYAVYTPIEYTATFLVDGEVVASIPFTLKDLRLEEPELPERAGYFSEWESYRIEASDLIINAVYTPIEYTGTFVAEDYPGIPNGYSGNSLEFYRYANHDGIFFDLDFAYKNDPTAITDWTGAEELWVYVNASKFADTTPKFRVNFQFTDSNGVAVANRVKFGATYYLIEKNGNTRSVHTALSDGYLGLPNQFEGWVCIPLEKETLECYWASGERTGEVVLNDVNQFMISVHGDNSSVDSYFYLDAFGFIGTDVDGADLPVNVAELSGYQFVEAWDLENLGLENSLNEIINDVFGTQGYYEIKVVGLEETVVKRVKFTIEDIALEEPEVPHREGYTGVWETYTIGDGALIIHAVYTSVQ